MMPFPSSMVGGAVDGGPVIVPPPDLAGVPDPLYWFAADNGATEDTAGNIQAQAGNRIQRWRNWGTLADNLPAGGAGPRYRTGGRNGKPYLDVEAGDYLADLPGAAQGDGTLTVDEWTAFFVTDALDLASSAWLLGSSVSSAYAKVSIVTGTGGEQRWVKSAVQRTPPKAATDLRVLMVQQNNAAGTYGWGHPAAPRDTFLETSNYGTGSPAGAQFLRHTGLGGVFRGHLYEFLYFRDELGASQCATVLNYLAAKYGYVA